MIYVKVDLTNDKVQQALALCDDDFKTDYPNNVLSVNVNLAGTLAWVKLAKEVNFRAYKKAVIETHTDNKAALAEIYANPNWYPPEEV